MRTFTFVFCELGAGPLTGSVAFVYVFETVKFTVVSAPGASGPYGFESASAVTEADGSVRLTLPLCGVVDQLWTTTGSVNDWPTATVWIAAERPRRSACGAEPWTHWSYSSQLPHRWKRPSTAGTMRTTLSV